MSLSKREGLKLSTLVSLFLAFALIAREYLRLELLNLGIADRHAATAATAAGIALFIATAWPLVGRFGLSLRGFFRPPSSIAATLLIGIASGVLFRALDWIFVLAASGRPGIPVLVAPGCRPALFGPAAISVFAQPIVEEVAHRGLLLAGLIPFGAAPAVLVSAVVFAAFHTTFVTPLLFGLFAASVALRARTLWIPVIAHGSFNLSNAIEAACIRVSAPDGTSLDYTTVAALTMTAIVMLAGLAYLAGAGTKYRPGASPYDP